MLKLPPLGGVGSLNLLVWHQNTQTPMSKAISNSVPLSDLFIFGWVAGL